MSAGTSSSASEFPVDEWKKIVERVLASWSGYQLAVEHQSGGPDTKEKHEVTTTTTIQHYRGKTERERKKTFEIKTSPAHFWLSVLHTH